MIFLVFLLIWFEFHFIFQLGKIGHNGPKGKGKRKQTHKNTLQEILLWLGFWGILISLVSMILTSLFFEIPII